MQDLIWRAIHSTLTSKVQTRSLSVRLHAHRRLRCVCVCARAHAHHTLHFAVSFTLIWHYQKSGAFSIFYFRMTWTKSWIAIKSVAKVIWRLVSRSASTRSCNAFWRTKSTRNISALNLHNLMCKTLSISLRLSSFLGPRLGSGQALQRWPHRRSSGIRPQIVDNWYKYVTTMQRNNNSMWSRVSCSCRKWNLLAKNLFDMSMKLYSAHLIHHIGLRRAPSASRAPVIRL